MFGLVCVVCVLTGLLLFVFVCVCGVGLPRVCLCYVCVWVSVVSFIRVCCVGVCRVLGMCRVRLLLCVDYLWFVS